MTLLAFTAVLVGICAVVVLALCRGAAAGRLPAETPLAPLERDPV